MMLVLRERIDTAVIYDAWPGAEPANDGAERLSVANNRLLDFFTIDGSRIGDCDASRYCFDFTHCGSKSDWYQYDGPQDANYFGHWCNPVTRQIVSFVEGDIYIIQCATTFDYVNELREFWRFDQRYDPGCQSGIDDHDGRHWKKLFGRQ